MAKMNLEDENSTKKMVCEKLKVRARETKAFIARTYFPTCSRAKLQER
jgi:hypothetical protein